jgi:LPS O-antigen subunit length determinant protein (WzzB/FepE family)
MNEELRACVEILRDTKSFVDDEDYVSKYTISEVDKAIEQAINLATQFLNAQTVMPKEITIEFKDFKIDTAEKAIASQVGFNDCLREVTLTHTKLMLAKDEQISKLQAEIAKARKLLEIAKNNKCDSCQR